jgi:hypothetical protein
MSFSVCFQPVFSLFLLFVVRGPMSTVHCRWSTVNAPRSTAVFGGQRLSLAVNCCLLWIAVHGQRLSLAVNCCLLWTTVHGQRLSLAVNCCLWRSTAVFCGPLSTVNGCLWRPMPVFCGPLSTVNPVFHGQLLSFVDHCPRSTAVFGSQCLSLAVNACLLCTTVHSQRLSLAVNACLSRNTWYIMVLCGTYCPFLPLPNAAFWYILIQLVYFAYFEVVSPIFLHNVTDICHQHYTIKKTTPKALKVQFKLRRRQRFQ